MENSVYELPVYFQELYEAADEADKPVIYALGVMRACGVKELSYHLDINSYDCVAHFRMLPSLSPDKVKELVTVYINAAWVPVNGVKFSQSRREMYQTKSDVLYFHASFQASQIRQKAYAGLT